MQRNPKVRLHHPHAAPKDQDQDAEDIDHPQHTEPRMSDAVPVKAKPCPMVKGKAVSLGCADQGGQTQKTTMRNTIRVTIVYSYSEAC